MGVVGREGCGTGPTEDAGGEGADEGAGFGEEVGAD